MPEWKEVAEVNGEALNELFGAAVDISGNYAIVGVYSGSEINPKYVRWYQRDDNKNWIEVFRDTQTTHGYGAAVAISGNYAVVGGSTAGGTAYWYQRDNNTSWKLIQTTTNTDSHYGRSVDISGNYAIVGGDYDQLTGVYFYQRKDNLSWELVDTYDADTTYDALGYSVSISGNYAIAGAPDWYNDNDRGKVYFFHRKDNLRWEMVYSHEGENVGDRFGYDVSISGNYALVGAREFNSNTGKVYFFQKKDDRNWQLIQTFTGENSDDYFGQSVSISGNYALVGAWGFNNGANYDGKIYYYQKTNSLEWEEKKTFTGAASAANNFGYDVSISGNYGIVGEHGADDVFANAGKVLFYARDK